MSNAILIKWTDDGKHKNKCDLVERRFILEDGELSIGQQVRAQFTKKRNSRAKIWGGVVVQRSAQEKKGKRTLKTSKKQPKDTVSGINTIIYIYIYNFVFFFLRNQTLKNLYWVLHHQPLLTRHSPRPCVAVLICSVLHKTL